MKNIKQILDNKDLRIGQYYVYISNEKKDPIVVVHQNASYQNKEHEQRYLESTGGCFLLRDIESNNVFDLHRIDYLESRYKIYPIDKENLGFILELFEFRSNRKNQNLLMKYYRKINDLK
ncbi:hypothetical protein [Chryseobacterium sp. JV274]|uniref:hypothetical protein n=1 Tax=Chryseobacterium sp. JV274 TaxID=1932669 RepID=UPI000986BA51|nr:hypothetical protein [Chryseobacterium sp. JV274]